MVQRAGSSGPIEPERDVTVAVGPVAAGVMSDVILPADAALIGVDAVQVVAKGAPAAGIGIAAAWIDPATGIVTIRLIAGSVGIGAVNLTVRIQSMLNSFSG